MPLGISQEINNDPVVVKTITTTYKRSLVRVKFNVLCQLVLKISLGGIIIFFVFIQRN